MNVARRPRASTRRMGRLPTAHIGSGLGGRPPETDCSEAQSPDCHSFSFAAGEGRHRVWGTALLTNESLSVNLLGGDAPHIGAVAIGVPRQGPAGQERQSVTTSVFALVGHKEDELARSMATELARGLGITSVVVAGVHLERARSVDIALVLQNADRALNIILARAASDAHPKRRR